MLLSLAQQLRQPRELRQAADSSGSLAKFTAIRRASSSVGNRLRIVESAAEERILASMERAAALLSPVQEGRIWRVRIVWANGAVHHFGKFTSEKDAGRWITAHPQLTKPVTEDEPVVIRNRVRSRKRRSPNLFST